MPVRPILSYPDARLRERAAPVTAFDDALQALAADLQDTLRDARALGITARHEEGSVSMPGFTETLDRPAVAVEAGAVAETLLEALTGQRDCLSAY